MKGNKKIISALLILIMLLMIIPAGMVSTSAAGKTADITVESVSALPGSTVEINVEIANNPGILGATLKLNYGEGLTLTNAVQGSAWDCLTMTKPGKFTSPCNFTWDGQDISESQIKDGNILKLTFEVAQTVEAGSDIPVEISYESGDIIGADLSSVSLNITNGQVSVINYTPGDVDGNGKVNSLDIINLRRYIAGGYDVVINELAANVNGDTKINTLDVIMIRRFIAGGYTDANGDPLVLLPSPGVPPHSHNILHVAAKEATAEAEGNIEYWYCSSCGKYFSDEVGKNIVTRNDVIIKELGHTVPITYHLYDGDTYLESVGVNNPNPEYKYFNLGLKLKNLTANGYIFDGWYDSEGMNGELIKTIPAGSDEPYDLYARWRAREYTVTFDSPLVPVASKKYTVNTGAELPEPELDGYIFGGWTDEYDNCVESIPIGTTGNITLYGQWISKRSLAKASSHSNDPIIIEDSDLGVMCYAYEIGTVQNVPVSDSQICYMPNTIPYVEFGSVKTSINQGDANIIANDISRKTVDSFTWNLSDGWEPNTELYEPWLMMTGCSLEQATSLYKSFPLSGQYKEYVTMGNGVSFLPSSHLSTEAVVDKDPPEWKVAFGGEYSFSEGDNPVYYTYTDENDKHSGTDTISIDTYADPFEATWNNEDASFDITLNNDLIGRLSDAIDSTCGYSDSYDNEYAYTTVKNTRAKTYSTLRYPTSEIDLSSQSFSFDGTHEGFYRYVPAATVHVFAVVGYDVASRSFFPFTFSVMDDDFYGFLDYSYSSSTFDDFENSVIPFEVPKDIYDRVAKSVTGSQGLIYRINSNDMTATVKLYEGDETDVVIPDYIFRYNSMGDCFSYRVTGITAGAFMNHRIRAVKMNRFIQSVPDSAFRGCSSLEEFYGNITCIGDRAFDGCTSLKKYTVSSEVTEIGEEAFNGVSELVVDAMSAQQALRLVNPSGNALFDDYISAYSLNKQTVIDISNAAISSGADNVTLNLDKTYSGIEYNFVVPTMDSFTINGGDLEFKNFRLTSKAKTTSLRRMNIDDCSDVPLIIHSDVLALNKVNVEAPEFCLKLACDGVTITAENVNTLNSESKKAMVCKNPVLDLASGSSYMVSSFEVEGDVYLCGSIVGRDHLTQKNGAIVFIQDDAFSNYFDDLGNNNP